MNQKPPHNLPVYTILGRYLGRVAEVESDNNNQVVYYHVAQPFWLGGLWRRRLLISPVQVVKITSERMVVEDLVERETATTPGIVPEVS